jgi:glycosyltransferase involved in cell wall biosynthesis
MTNPIDAETAGLVSVAIPAYNAAATLAQTLHSVLAQTHRQIEVIVVDDGSTDATPEVLRSFGASIRVIRQPNGGLAAARNAGLKAARGEYVALMDADDLCEPERIATQVKFLSEHAQVLLCCSDFSAFTADGPVSASHIARYYSRCSPAQGGVVARYPKRGVLDLSGCLPSGDAAAIAATTATATAIAPVYFGSAYVEIAQGNFVHPPTVMFRRRVLDEVGLFDPGALTMCDWDWLAKVARAGEIGHIDRPLLRYRLSATQMSSSRRSLMDSLQVAHRIVGRDPLLWGHNPRGFRAFFGEMSADAAEIEAESHPLNAMSLLAASAFRHRRWERRTLRTLVKALMPSALVGRLRGGHGAGRGAA